MSKPKEEAELPEFIRDFLDIASATCLVTNPFDTLLAVGTNEGTIQVWDIEVLSLASTISLTKSPVLKIQWSADGHYIAAATSDQKLTLVKVLFPDQRQLMSFDDDCDDLISFDLNRNHPMMCLVTFKSFAPVLINFQTREKTHLPELTQSRGSGSLRKSILQELPKMEEQEEELMLPIAVFDAPGARAIYGQSHHGLIICLDLASWTVIELYRIPIKRTILGFCLENDLLVVYLQKCCPSIYQVDFPTGVRNGVALNEAQYKLRSKAEESSLLKSSHPCLRLIMHMQHPLPVINECSWDLSYLMKIPKSSIYTHIVCSTSIKTQSPFSDQHLMHIWNLATGEVQRVLEGPEDGLVDLCWNQKFDTLMSLSSTGKIYLWSKRHLQNWSTFAPCFEELEENEEYVESETEFDANEREDLERIPSRDSHLMDIDVSSDTSAEIDIFGSDHNNEENNLIHLPIVLPSLKSESKEEKPVQEAESFKIKLSIDKTSERNRMEDSSKPSRVSISESNDDKRLKLRFRRKPHSSQKEKKSSGSNKM